MAKDTDNARLYKLAKDRVEKQYSGGAWKLVTTPVRRALVLQEIVNVIVYVWDEVTPAERAKALLAYAAQQVQVDYP